MNEKDHTLEFPTVTDVIELNRSGPDYYLSNKFNTGERYMPYRFLSIPSDAMQKATERGSHVHMCASDYAKQLYPYWKANAEILPWMEQFDDFWTTCKCKLLATEERCSSAIHQYRGRLDFRLIMHHGLTGKEHEAVSDLKTGQRPSNTQPNYDAIQTQAYRSCYMQEMRRYALYLTDHSWKLIEHKERTDYSGWQGMLYHYKWVMKQRNLKGG